MGEGLYLDVVFNLNVDRTFQYSCPPRLAARALPGARVVAPFRDRPRYGIIVGTGANPRVDRVLPIDDIPDAEPLLSPLLMNLLCWVADTYLSTTGMALRAACPETVLRGGLAPPAGGKRLYAEAVMPQPGAGPKPLSDRLKKALEAALAEGGPLPVSRLIAMTGATHRALRSMEARGLLRLFSGPPAVLPVPPPRPRATVVLSRPQEEAVRRIGLLLDSASPECLVLEGPPGCGKMEVFLQAVARSLPEDRQALILVPELSLTPPLESRLESFFPGQVAVFHSRLSRGQKLAAWLRCRSGQARVAVGSRSAVFLPLPRLAIIFIDEEQEPAYKSEESPRYHGRDTAAERARLEGIPVVLSSPAPSLETMAMRRKPGAQRITLPECPRLRGSVDVTVVDMNGQTGRDDRILSGPLRHALRGTFQRGEKAVLFVNRRGLAAAAFCADCAYTPRCPNCSAALSLADDRGRLACRICGHRETYPLACPRCGGSGVRRGSTGTGGVAAELGRLFPNMVGKILDRDSISRKGDLERILDEFDRGDFPVLIGTQLLARGHHWTGVSTVGVVDADTELHRPDFRAAERSYQLLSQVAGLAGWGLHRGRLVIQTHYPGHYAVQAVAGHDPGLFYRRELALRREVGFPPFGSLTMLTLEGSGEESVARAASRLRQALDAAPARTPDVDILGPNPSPLSRRRQRHRCQILVKGPARSVLRDVVREAVSAWGTSETRSGVRLSADVDPVEFR